MLWNLLLGFLRLFGCQQEAVMVLKTRQPQTQLPGPLTRSFSQEACKWGIGSDKRVMLEQLILLY